jgi:hypothetical protein
MIERIGTKQIVASVDVPTGYSPEMNSHYDTIIDYVENSLHPIAVSLPYSNSISSRNWKLLLSSRIPFSVLVF